MDALARAGDGPGRAAAAELHHRVPGHDRVRPTIDSGDLPRLARQGARARSTPSAPSRPSGASAATRSSSASASRPTSRCAASRRRGSSARSATSPAAGTRRRSAASERHGAGADRHLAARAGHETAGRRSRRRARLRRRRDRGAARRHDRQPARDGHVRQPQPHRRRDRALQTAQKIVAKARTLAAHQLGVDEDEPQYEGGTFSAADAAVTIKELAFAAWSAHNLPPGFEPASRRPPSTTRPTSAGRRRHAAVVEIDTETGTCSCSATSRSTTSARCQPDDRRRPDPRRDHAGRRAGPLRGGVYDEDGSLLTSSLTNYLVPSAVELPNYELD